MVYIIVLFLVIGLLILGFVVAIDRFVPQKANLWICAVFALLSLFLGYKIYQSISAPVQFEKVRQERYAQVIAKLKDIKNAQEAHKIVRGTYANTFDSLIQFIDTAYYTITQQRDSSFMRFDSAYRIEVQKDTVVLDTLGFVAVKDSLFGNSNRYKTLMQVPFAQNGEIFEMKAGIIEKSGYKVPVFEVKVAKDIILHDQAEDLVAREKAQQSVEEVNGIAIKVGSLTEVSTNGNWPPIYDRKNN